MSAPSGRGRVVCRFPVDILHRPEELEGLVDQVAAEVVQDPAAGPRPATSRQFPDPSGRHRSKRDSKGRTFAESPSAQLPERQVVGVPGRF